mmetsp:Transcript_4174/g.8390  ORF Transcript_4174/g.8390 Transcript_4174/m.8390 type:complete len:135 (-) Transcript_4174:194-598(-)
MRKSARNKKLRQPFSSRSNAPLELQSIIENLMSASEVKDETEHGRILDDGLRTAPLLLTQIPEHSYALHQMRTVLVNQEYLMNRLITKRKLGSSSSSDDEFDMKLDVPLEWEMGGLLYDEVNFEELFCMSPDRV